MYFINEIILWKKDIKVNVGAFLFVEILRTDINWYIKNNTSIQQSES